jgi:hypothetical protein
MAALSSLTAAENFNISVSGSLRERADRVELKFESWQNNEPAISPRAAMFASRGW